MADADSGDRAKEHLAEEIMRTDVLTAETGITVKKAVDLMTRRGLGCLVVLKNDAAVGIVTERDILNKITAEGVDPARVLVQDIMTAPLISVDKKSTIREIAEKMSTFQVRRTIVIDQKGVMAGLVMAEDLTRWVANNGKASDPTFNIAGKSRSASPYG